MTLTTFSDYSELFRGCVAYWDGSVSGNTYYDVIGSYNGTIVNATKTGTSRFGVTNGVMAFNGDDYISTGYKIESANGTVCAWVKLPTGTISSAEKEICGHYTASYKGFQFIQSSYCAAPNSFTVNMNYGTSQDTLVPPNEDYRGVWTFVVVTWKAPWLMYINGTLKATNSRDASPASGTDYMYIGAASINGSPNQYQGYTNDPCYIGELMIYNRALSAGEVKAIYNLTSKKYLYPVMSGVRSVE